MSLISSSLTAILLSIVLVPVANAWNPTTLRASVTTKYDIRVQSRSKRSTAQKIRLASVELPTIAKGGLVFGDPEATTTIVMFSDMEDPFVKIFYEKTYTTLKKNYLDKGRVRFVVRHFPLSVLHSYAEEAALAIVCAREQGDDKATLLHDILVKTGQKNFTVNTVRDAYMWGESLDVSKMESCLRTYEKRQVIDEDLKAGADAGVIGPPGFFVIGPHGTMKRVEEWQYSRSFTKAIRQVQ